MRVLLILSLLTLISSTLAQTNVLRAKRSKSLKPARHRAAKGVENPFEMPNQSDDEPDESNSAQICPVSLSDSFDLIRAINNFRITHSLQAINISRSLMSTACAHLRDIVSSEASINNDCGLHSWSSCCYPSDHSNPNCMHRKALQVTTALRWNIYNVAAYELAYEWAGGPFSAIRALDMFVANPDHKKFLLQEDTWSDFKWRAIGASVGDRYAYIWFGTLVDPNGDFDQTSVEGHVLELPGCACTGTPITWKPTPTLSPEQQAQLEQRKKLESIPSLYMAEPGQEESIPIPTTSPPAENLDAAANATTVDEGSLLSNSSGNISDQQPQAPVAKSTVALPDTVATPSKGSNATMSSNSTRPTAVQNQLETNDTQISNSSKPESNLSGTVFDNKPSDGVKQVSISLSDFLKGLTQG